MNADFPGPLQFPNGLVETFAARCEAQRNLIALLRHAARPHHSAPLAPDVPEIRRHLAAIHGESPEGALFEVRGIAEGRRTRARLFPATARGFTEGASVAASWNATGWNTYTGVNLRRPGTPCDCAASADDVLPEARWLVADLDTVPDAEARLRALTIQPRLLVWTGTVPHPRVQAYWRLAEPLALTDWTELQRELAAHLDADASLTDPPRVVRLAGTVNWPKATKRARGYVTETVRAERWRDAPYEVSAVDVLAMIGTAAPTVQRRELSEAEDDWTATVETRSALPPPSLARIRSALAFLDPEPRGVWVRVGAALKAHSAETGNDVESLFVEWSRGDLRHDGARTPSTFQGDEDCRRLLMTLRRDGGAP